MCVILWRARGKNSTYIQSLLPLQTYKPVPCIASKDNASTTAEKLRQMDRKLEIKATSAKGPVHLSLRILIRPKGKPPR